ncbi:MAG: DNA alkylation repair protein [Chloroflexota bacterium]
MITINDSSRPAEAVLNRLKALADPEKAAGMAHFAVGGAHTLGISIPTLRALAKEIGKSHELAGELWASGIHEARLLATMINPPRRVTEAQLEAWVQDFDSWDVCDQACNNLFSKTPWAAPKAVEWSGREAEFVKRAGFVLMATLAVHDKQAGDESFMAWLRLIQRQAADERNFVKKAVNWALRQIGKRNLNLNRLAIQTAEEMQRLDSKSARWIAADALRELTSDRVQQRLRQKAR